MSTHRRPVTVRELIDYLQRCGLDDPAVVSSTLADGAGIRVDRLEIGTEQGGADGEGIEVVIGWAPGDEVTVRS